MAQEDPSIPVITLNCDRFSAYVGKMLTVEDMQKWLPWLGIDIEESGSNYVKVEFNPNRIDFSSHAGIARAFRGLMEWETGLPRYEARKGNITLTVNQKVSEVRPYVLSAIIRDLKLDDEIIKEIIDIQEDLHWGLGRNRKKASIGVHNLDAVQPPFIYTTSEPRSSFIPLDEEKEMSLQEILKDHDKGREYRHLVELAPEYPLIVDRKGRVLSFPPIINSELTRISDQTKHFFIDVTGTDLNAIKRSLNVLVTALADMGGTIESVEVKYSHQTMSSPNLTPQKMKLRIDYAQRLLGLKFTFVEAIRNLQRCRLNAERESEGVLMVSIPAYRIDIMHEVDLVEELAIGYGFYKLTPTKPTTVTTGKGHEVSVLTNHARQIMIGLGFMEVLNFILTNEIDQYSKMKRRVKKAVKLVNPVSAEYTILREELLSGLMKNLSDNRHERYPQRIFEASDIIKVNLRRETGTERRVHVAGASCHATANFTEIKTFLEALLTNLGIKYDVNETKHPSFISGRVAKINHRGKGLGVLGEIHPEVLNNFKIENPTSAFEIDLEELLQKN